MVQQSYLIYLFDLLSLIIKYNSLIIYVLCFILVPLNFSLQLINLLI